MGERRWYIARCLLALGYGVNIWDMEGEMTERSRRTELIFPWDLNVDLEGPDGM